jgi:hypothetical protein
MGVRGGRRKGTWSARASWASVLALVLVVQLPFKPATAASPPDGTLSFAHPLVEWHNDEPLTGALPRGARAQCALHLPSCDSFPLTIDTSVRGARQRHALVEIALSPSDGADMSLALVPPGCPTGIDPRNRLCTNSPGTQARLLDPENGVWTVIVFCGSCVDASYEARATVTDAPAFALPPAGADLGWERTTMPKLTDGEPADLVGEPGIWINARGQVIINTFGPIVWTSQDNGRTFSPGVDLFEADTLCPRSKFGVYVIDADAVVANDGTFYADNLCAPVSNETFSNRAGGVATAWAGPAPAGLNVDRQWLVPDPGTPGSVYLAFGNFSTQMTHLLKSTDYGATWRCPATGLVSPECPIAPAAAAPQVLDNRLAGRPVIDPTDPNRIYLVYDHAPFEPTLDTASDFDTTRIRVAVSTDGGRTWALDADPGGAPVLDANVTFPYNGTDDNRVGHILPAAAIDTAGNLYVVFSLRLGGQTETHLYLLSSANHGRTWGAPTRVDQDGLRSNVLPWIVAGDPGRIAMSWYGSLSNSFDDTGAAWSEMFSASVDALSAAPTFTQSNVSGSAVPNHLADICQAGSNCSGNQNLADFQMIAVDPCGFTHPVWTSDVGGEAYGSTVTARQTKGMRLYANPQCDRSSRH